MWQHSSFFLPCWFSFQSHQFLTRGLDFINGGAFIIVEAFYLNTWITLEIMDGYQFVSDTEAIINSAYKSNYLLTILFLWKQRKVSIVNKTVLYESEHRIETLQGRNKNK